MKIGILTFHSVDNYGAVLQAYALQSYISSLGHDAEVIDYRPKYFHGARKWSMRPGCLANNITSCYKGRKFEDFRHTFLNRTEACSNQADLEVKLPQYDVVVVGSDQVWSPDVDRRTEADPIYFFNWRVPAATRKIAYAASFGSDAINATHVCQIQNGLSNIDAISVREESGIKIVKALSGRDAKWVCDPVNLLCGDDWKSMSGYRPNDSGAFVGYMLPTDVILSLSDCCRNRRSIFSHIGWNARVSLRHPLSIAIPSPLGFVRILSESRGVVSQSFHGISFAIILHKPFVYIKPEGVCGKRSVRVTDILARVGLSERILQGDVNGSALLEKMAEPIDWDKVERKRNLFVEQSKEWLHRNIDLTADR